MTKPPLRRFLRGIFHCRKSRIDCIVQSRHHGYQVRVLSTRTTNYEGFDTSVWKPNNHLRWLSTNNEKKKEGDCNDDDADTNDDVANSSSSVLTQLRSLPNLITLTRMASTPLLAYWIVSENYGLAIGGCTLAAGSDFLDGYLAKNHGGSTVVGTYLDPLADKVFVNTLGVSLWYSGILPTPLVLLWAGKDLALLTGTAWLLHQKYRSVNIFTTSVAKKPLKVSPSLIAKVNTAFQFATIGVGILTPVVIMPPLVLDSLCWVTGTTTVCSILSYAGRSGFVVESTAKEK